MSIGSFECGQTSFQFKQLFWLPHFVNPVVYLFKVGGRISEDFFKSCYESLQFSEADSAANGIFFGYLYHLLRFFFRLLHLVPRLFAGVAGEGP
jgi:hypothetical protein